ncbi:zinc finger protein 692-like [Spea bombifrons]|uniref:zinc finger protein 692-like n=1 Tax=Spea bombifrons TaxID=233779 RepID=UPI0023492706|nr:zinc finger protein 692-like [Spea bombifrons]
MQASVRREKRRLLDARRGKCRVRLGSHLDEWCALKDRLGFTLHSEVAKFLLDSYRLSVDPETTASLLSVSLSSLQRLALLCHQHGRYCPCSPSVISHSLHVGTKELSVFLWGCREDHQFQWDPQADGSEKERDSNKQNRLSDSVGVKPTTIEDQVTQCDNGIVQEGWHSSTEAPAKIGEGKSGKLSRQKVCIKLHPETHNPERGNETENTHENQWSNPQTVAENFERDEREHGRPSEKTEKGRVHALTENLEPLKSVICEETDQRSSGINKTVQQTENIPSGEYTGPHLPDGISSPNETQLNIFEGHLQSPAGAAIHGNPGSPCTQDPAASGPTDELINQETRHSIGNSPLSQQQGEAPDRKHLKQAVTECLSKNKWLKRTRSRSLSDWDHDTSPENTKISAKTCQMEVNSDKVVEKQDTFPDSALMVDSESHKESSGSTKVKSHSMDSSVQSHSRTRPHVEEVEQICNKKIKQVTDNSMKADPQELFLCEFADCGKIFSKRQYLNHHQKYQHVNQRTFRCSDPKCGRSFNFKKHLKEHEKKHSDRRDFICEFCARAFRTNSNLIIHRRIHTGEKPLQCEFCGFTCRQKASLNWHMKKHDADSLYQFPCDICGQRFEKRDNLAAHRSRKHPEPRDAIPIDPTDQSSPCQNPPFCKSVLPDIVPTHTEEEITEACPETIKDTILPETPDQAENATGSSLSEISLVIIL